ncbi:MAG: hypothetical protein K6G81_10645 [Lachnospiraceae bacterium]|nr:hypothetical protein [Lachnospiraceae bacterium]
MYRKNRAAALATVLIMCMTILVSPKHRALAAVLDFPAASVQLDVPDDALIMTPTTAKYDEVWGKAGVTDSASKLKEFQSMGVVAAFYDPATKTTVNFITNRNNITAEQFTLEGMSEAQVEEYINGLMGSGEDVRTSVTAFSHDTVPFFRLVIDGMSEKAQGREIIYGTIINGQMVQFDVYTETIQDIDESFLKKIVDSVKFTRIMTREDYEEEATAAMHKFFIGVGVFFGALIALVIYAIFRKRARKRKTAAISQAVTDFRERRKNGDIADNEIPLFTAHIELNDAAINSFGTFNTWIRVWPVLAGCTLLYLAIIVLMLNKGFPLYALLTVIAGVVLLYMHYTRLEKLKEAMKKRFRTKNKPSMTIRFFDEYFTTGGVESVSEYIYQQVTDVSVYQDYIFVYTGDENAVMLTRAGVDGGKADELIAMLKERNK